MNQIPWDRFDFLVVYNVEFSDRPGGSTNAPPSSAPSRPVGSVVRTFGAADAESGEVA